MNERPRSAVQALQLALERHAQWVPPDAATSATKAVLSYADETVGCSMAAPREMWAGAGYRDHFRRRMRHDLLENIINRGVVPVALPQESLKYLVSWLNRAVPEESAEWDTVEVLLQVDVRRPPVENMPPAGERALTG